MQPFTMIAVKRKTASQRGPTEPPRPRIAPDPLVSIDPSVGRAEGPPYQSNAHRMRLIQRASLPVLVILLLTAALWWLLQSEDTPRSPSRVSEVPGPATASDDPVSSVTTLADPSSTTEAGTDVTPREPAVPELRVLDWLGGPIEGAHVTQGEQELGATNIGGRLPLPVGWSRGEALEVEANGYARFRGHPDPELLEIRLRRALAVFGELRTADGQPVEEFTLLALGEDSPDVRLGDRFRNGRFELTGLPEARLLLHFDAPRHPRLELRGIVPSEQPLQVQLPAGGALHGSVLSTAGEPLVGMWVTAMPAQSRPPIAGRSLPAQSPSQQTGPQGAFRFEGLLPGDYRLVLGQIAEPIEEVSPVLVTAGQSTEHTFRIAATGRLELTVVGENGLPLSGVQVRLYHRGFGYQRVGETDADGQFEAGDLLIGSYRVSATLDGHDRLAKSFTIPGGTPQLHTETMKRREDR